MNLKVRMKNWSFWVSIAASIFAPIFAYFGISAADLNTWSSLEKILLEAISNPYVVGMVVVSVYNTLIDPTTKGIADSARAMGYTVPGGDEK